MKAWVLTVLFLSTSTLAQTPSEWRRPEQEINEAWRVRKEVISVRQDSLATGELDRIKVIRDRYGLSNLPVLSAALLQEFKDRSATALLDPTPLLEYAETFSPNPVWVSAFRCTTHTEKEGFVSNLRSCWQSWKLDVLTDGGRLRAFNNALFVATIAWIGFMILFGVVLISTYTGPLAHHWAHHFRGARPLAIQLFGLFILVISWVTLGWIGVGLAITLLLWRYLRWGEKTLLMILIAAACALPLGLHVTTLYLQLRQSIVPILMEPLEGPSLEDRAKRLEAWILRNPSDAEALFTLASIERRVGRTTEARELLERAFKTRPSWPKPLVNLATLEYASGNTMGAIGHLQKAISVSPQSLTAHFNLGKILYQETRLEEGKSELTKAKNIDPARFEQLERTTGNVKGSQPILVDETVTPQELRERIWASTPEHVELQRRLHRSLFPNLPLPAYWIVLVGVLILAMILERIRPTQRLPRACEKCGLPSCALCDSSVERESLCAQCFHIFVRLEAIDPKSRQDKERKIARHRFARTLRERWSALLVPGWHRLFRGEYGIGLLWSLLSLTALAPILCKGSLLASTAELAGLRTFPWMVVAGIGYALLLCLAIVDAVRR